MKVGKRLALLCAFISLFKVELAGAVPFTNGDFSGGLTGWNTVLGNGSVAVAGGQAQLETGSGTDPFSASLIQGDDGFASFAPALTLGASDLFLVFDIRFEDLGAAAEGGAGPFTDSLAVSVFDALDFTLDLLFGSIADVSDAGPKQVMLDVSSLAGRDVALYFDLVDEQDNRDSRVLIDNVFFTDTAPTSVPEPLAVWLALAGLAFVSGSRSRRAIATKLD